LASRSWCLGELFSRVFYPRGRPMQRPNCSVCGLPAAESGGLCPHCGNKPVIGPKPDRSRNSESESEHDFTKYLAVGVFTGALIAASLLLFLVFSSGGVQKTGGGMAPAQETLIQSPTHAVPTPAASPQDEPVDDRKPAAGQVKRTSKRPPPGTADDGKRKRQDIIETSGKNPKMTQY